MYKALGIDSFYDVSHFHVTPENSTGWGLKDKEFLTQSADLMKDLPQPFYSNLITLTNHFPFQIDDEDKLIDEYDSESDILNRYVTTVRYEDEALKHFIAKLKKNGLYDNSVIVFMGDHYGISEAHNDALAQFWAKTKSPLRYRSAAAGAADYPHSGVTDQDPKTISETGGQIDVKPTLLHLLGIDTKGMIQFGNDLFSKERMPFAVLRNGSFITDDYIYTKIRATAKTGDMINDGEDKCGPLIEKANEELSLSDKIINGDLLRFYKNNPSPLNRHSRRLKGAV